jgi:hypothetical protein
MPIPQGGHDLSVSGCRCLIIQRGNLISRIMAILTQVTSFDKGQFDMIAEASLRLAHAASSRPITDSDSLS